MIIVIVVIIMIMMMIKEAGLQQRGHPPSIERD